MARPFDAAVGRYILMYVKEPAASCGTVARVVRPGGVIAFLDVTVRIFLDELP